MVAGVVVVAAVFVARFIFLNTAPHDADEFMFALGARDILQGHLPPDGVFDNKPVGLLYLFALAELAGGQTVAAIQGLGFLCAALTAMLVYATARNLRSPPSIAMTLAALTSVEIVCLGGWLTMSELAASPLIAAANLLLARSVGGRGAALVGAGALFGAACQITYLAAPLAALTGAAILLDRRLTVREVCLQAFWFGLGALGAILALWAPQMIGGGWPAFIAQQAAYHAQYRQIQLPLSLVLVTMVGPLALLALPFLAAFLELKGAIRGTRSTLARILAMQVIGALLAAVVSNHFYSHYLILALPALALLLGRLLSGLSARHQALGVAACLGCAAAFFLSNLTMLRGWPSAAAFEQRSAAMIDARIGRDKPVLVFDESPAIYYLSGSRVAGRFVFLSHYMPSCLEVAMSNPETVLAGGIAQGAALILLGNQCPTEFDSAAVVRHAGYRLVGHVAEGGRSIDAYAPQDR
jgi:hypothetical protein